jgi:hypothetical protein
MAEQEHRRKRKYIVEVFKKDNPNESIDTLFLSMCRKQHAERAAIIMTADHFDLKTGGLVAKGKIMKGDRSITHETHEFLVAAEKEDNSEE